MKAKDLKRIETLTAALLLTLLLGCGPAKQPEPEAEESAPAAPPVAVAPAETPAPAAAPAAAATAPATGLSRWDAAPNGSKMKMEGTSNVHDWNMESTVLGGFLEADAKFPEVTSGPVTAQVFIPVRSFKSSSKVMDGKMQQQMKEPQFKRIDYKLVALSPKPGATAGAGAQFDAVGELTVAGKTRTNTMPVTIAKVDGSKLMIKGSTELKMTDCGVEPPTLTIAGVGLKTGDDIKLTFEWLLAPKAP